MVNERWEGIRSVAMERQQILQNRLNSLQTEHLKKVVEWLAEFEKIILHIGQKLSDDPEVCRNHIAAHTQIQEQIEAQQPSIQRLASFIAVEDRVEEQQSEEESNSEQKKFRLESLLEDVGKR